MSESAPSDTGTYLHNALAYLNQLQHEAPASEAPEPVHVGVAFTFSSLDPASAASEQERRRRRRLLDALLPFGPYERVVQEFGRVADAWRRHVFRDHVVEGPPSALFDRERGRCRDERKARTSHNASSFSYYAFNMPGLW
jgi:hypothetical protein